jgi:GxxExxY protein
MMSRDQLNKLGKEILGACIAVHKELGPGLLESIYVYSLLKELQLRGINAVAKIGVPLIYKGYDTGKYFEIDILVEGEIILEIKSSEFIHPVYQAQIISYLKLANKKLGYLVNFNVVLLKDGFMRFVNNF